MKKEKIINKSVSGPTKQKKQALGRGLDALLPDIESFEEKSEEYFECELEAIHPNRYQPRVIFSDNELAELTESIKAQGIIQPILVRKDDHGYEIIAGERRFRAAKKAGLNRVPVLIKNIGDSEMLEMSIVENIQRENLNPMEESEAYYRLISEFDLTQDLAAERVGKSRSAVANLLRLRQLPEQIKTSLREGALSMGHARALLASENSAQQTLVWRTVISKRLSVRETERLVKKLKTQKEKAGKPKKTSDEIYFIDLAENLSRKFGTKVEIKRLGQKGKVQIEFYSNDDLDRLLNLLK